MNFKEQNNMNIAVIGSGISGICCAYLLQNRHRITLFEKNNYFGGHTHTVMLPDGPDKHTPVDTGFIVLNERTYPNFIHLLSRLGVEKSRTDMSFSYYCKKTGLYYASRNLNSIFAQRSNLLRPKFIRFVYEMVRFLQVLRKEYLADRLTDITLSDYAQQKGLHCEVIDQFIIPMAAAIWSGSDFQMSRFPIRTFAQFYENHGLLGVTGHPPWYFVKGGSHTYVNAFLKSFNGKAVKNSPVMRISRQTDGITLHFQQGDPQVFDAVVIASHADQALKLLEKPTSKEKELLGAWSYSNNKTFLHTDISVMPPNQRAWASWNYTRHAQSDADSPVTVSYDMTHLQKLKTKQRYFVTLNPKTPIPAKHIIKEIHYAHPQYSYDAFQSQKQLPALNGEQNTFFCGAYFGFGFHEDGVNSALGVGEKFGVTL
ncbi:MAG: FAD-dependent oxidoreductase [Proteobacteria bacterium]|nr:FAD-dependent oxidoreductase [Pseudomonadota bacterium]MBU1387279.1 FAD-dependent oxidoreductase [Pseudomonadota bacterium]MBU1544260.1 FAD-dependent oxidoreductase [Pseudomonadota bacterium]MBU2481492.1 FAD-dependent oxidoreductase [Pseudomonadota bacterium]